MKKFLALALSSVLALSLLAGCGSSNTPAASGSSGSAGSASTGETVTLKVGASITPHAEILNQCKPILAEQGIDLEVVEYTDYVQPNTALEEGQPGRQLLPAHQLPELVQRRVRHPSRERRLRPL